jgi:myb proto-oncogene protein
VRRYQNQGLTLSNAPSSPSDSGTPAALSNYHDDDEYRSSNPQTYDTLLTAPSHVSRRHSRSSCDTDAYSIWSSPQGYGMSTAISGPSAHHTSTEMLPYAYTQPPQLGPNVPSTWDQTMPYMHHPSSSLHTGAPGTPSVYGYSAYPIAQQPIITPSPAYTASADRAPYATIPNRLPFTLASEQINDPNVSAIYRNARHQQHPYHQL